MTNYKTYTAFQLESLLQTIKDLELTLSDCNDILEGKEVNNTKIMELTNLEIFKTLFSSYEVTTELLQSNNRLFEFLSDDITDIYVWDTLYDIPVLSLTTRLELDDIKDIINDILDVPQDDVTIEYLYEKFVDGHPVTGEAQYLNLLQEINNFETKTVLDDDTLKNSVFNDALKGDNYIIADEAQHGVFINELINAIKEQEEEDSKKKQEEDSKKKQEELFNLFVGTVLNSIKPKTIKKKSENKATFSSFLGL